MLRAPRAAFAVLVLSLFIVSWLPAEAQALPPGSPPPPAKQSPVPPPQKSPEGSKKTPAGQAAPPGPGKAPRASDSPAEKMAKARDTAKEARQLASEAKAKGQESKAKAEEARAKAADAREKAESARARAEEAKAKVQEARAKGEKFFDITLRAEYRSAAQERATHLQEQSRQAKESVASAKDNLNGLKERLKSSPGDSKTRGETLAALRDAQVAAAEQMQTAAEQLGASISQAASQESSLSFVRRLAEAQGIDYQFSQEESESEAVEFGTMADELASRSQLTESGLQETLVKLKSKYSTLKVNHSKRSCETQTTALQTVAERLGDSAAQSALSKVQERCGQISDEKSAESTTKETKSQIEEVRAKLKDSLAAAVKAGTGPDVRSDNITATGAPRITSTPLATVATGVVTAPGISSRVDIKVTGMEVSQGIQDLNNDMPLVEDRRTIVRVYAKNTRAGDVSGVNARLIGARTSGSDLSGSPLEAENNPITVKSDGGQRVNLDDSFWFILPEDWLSGTVVLMAEVNYDDNVTESDKSDNWKQKIVTFNRAETFNMVIVPMHMHWDTSGGPWDDYRVFDGEESYRWDIYNNMYRLHPIAHLGSEDSSTVWKFNTYLTPDGHLSGGEFDWDDNGGTEGALAAVVELDDSTEDWVDDLRYVGALHTDIGGAYGKGKTNGVDLDALVRMRTGHDSYPDWYDGGGNSMAHELAHTEGRLHVDCDSSDGDDGGDANYPYPYPDCQLAKVDPEGYYGLDVYYSKFGLDEPAVISNDPSASSSHRGYPLLGYQRPRWIDPYTYCALLERYGVTCGLSFSPPAAPTPLPSADPARVSALRGAGKVVTIAGVFDPEQNTGNIGRVGLQEAKSVFSDTLSKTEKRLRVLAATGGSKFSLEVQDSGGKSLYSLPLLIDETADHPDSTRGQSKKSKAITFREVVPWSDKAARVVLKYSDKTLATKAPSAGAPSVTLLSPNGGEKLSRDLTIRWKGSDPDGDSLRFNILYSTDGGLKWKAVALGVSGSEYTFEKTPPGAAKAKFRVVASDGVHTAHDDSDGTFTVPGSAPSVVIHSPKDGRTLLGKRALLLDGSAEDAEDGGLKGRSLVWSSDKAGVLGTGSEVRLNLSKLDSGKHTITLAATDSDGMTGKASATITVGALAAKR